MTILPIFALTALVATQKTPTTALIIGGGPNIQNNQVAIESNIRYVERILPRNATRTVLFGDGKRESKIVQYLEKGEELAPEELALRLLLNERTDSKQTRYRAPQSVNLDGPSQRQAIATQFSQLASVANPQPLLVYFTGHGSPGQSRRDYENNVFDLWSEPGLTVRDLAFEMNKLPKTQPVALVMVQCYSGSFANLLFEGGDPNGALTTRPFCGFFATIKERVAAGCTPEVEEEEYHDFTSYFFAALVGKDRLGRTVKSPDYNRDGKTGMDEAFYYALINEPSIDIPVATTDLFLRRFVKSETPDAVTKVPFSSLYKTATAGQKAAMDGLSQALGIEASGEDRIQKAWTNYLPLLEDEGKTEGQLLDRPTMQYLLSQRNRLAERFPDLRFRNGRYRLPAEQRGEALSYLKARPDDVKRLGAVVKAMAMSEEENYKGILKAAQWLRLLRVANSVYLEQLLRRGGDKVLIGQFEKLRALEAGNPFI
jgi:hypothetical protein